MDINLEEMRKKREIIDGFLEILGGSENAPLDFKIMNEDRKANKLYEDIMLNKNFHNSSNENEEKRALYSFKKQEVQFLEELKEKIENN